MLQRHGKSASLVPIVLNEFHTKIGTSERTEELLNPLATFTIVRDNFTVLPSSIDAKVPALYRKSHLSIPRNESVWPRSQFLYSCICERFIYSQDQSAY